MSFTGNVLEHIMASITVKATKMKEIQEEEAEKMFKHIQKHLGLTRKSHL